MLMEENSIVATLLSESNKFISAADLTQLMFANKKRWTYIATKGYFYD